MDAAIAQINLWQGVPYVWGVRDCILVLADWIKAQRGVDPASDLRMTYETLGECQRVTGFFTDPVAVIGPCMEACGIDRTDAPVRGDVGLVLLPSGAGVLMPSGGLCLGRQWAIFTHDQGVMVCCPPKVVAAWSVGL